MSHRVLGEQMDMLAEHFKQWSGHNEAAVVPDKRGDITYVGLLQDPNDPESHEVHAYRQDDKGYEHVGNLYTMQHQPGDPAEHSHEVGMVEVSPAQRRRGIATSMWDFGRQFLDVRHSDSRTDDGAAWTHSIGGPDMDGTDTSTYLHPGDRLS